MAIGRLSSGQASVAKGSDVYHSRSQDGLGSCIKEEIPQVAKDACEEEIMSGL